MSSSLSSPSVARRVAALVAHVAPDAASAADAEAARLDDAPVALPSAAYKRDDAVRATLNKFLVRFAVDRRRQLAELLATHPLFGHNASFYNKPKETQREINTLRIRHLAAAGFFDSYMRDPLDYLGVVMEIHAYEPSLGVKSTGVHFGLFCGSITALGTQYHLDTFVKPAAKLEIMGSFSLTELGHGSNVQGIETVVTYDKATQEFVVNSPTESSQKFWIGGMMSATHSVVFGSLIMDGENKGIHAFVVPLRNPDYTLAQGVQIADCGHKEGLNGVDNGRAWFTNARIPRVNMLNKYANVDENGVYSSPIESSVERFTTSIAALVSGRVFMVLAVSRFTMYGAQCALRYSLTRRQFGDGNGPETFLIDYPLYQQRLFPLLAQIYVLNSAGYRLGNMFAELRAKKMSASKDIHVLSAGFKPIVTWLLNETMNEARQMTGGLGFATANIIAPLRQAADVWQTFEGDNNVLLQQVSRSLLKDYAVQAPKKTFSDSLDFLNHADFQFDGNVRNTANMLKAFALREKLALQRAGKAVMAARSKHSNQWEAWNAAVPVTNELAMAHMDRIAIELFVEEIKEAQYAPAHAVFELLGQLYVLTRIKTSPFFLKSLTAVSFDAVLEGIAAVCAELRPWVYELGEGFGIHEQLLPPIAHDWVHYYSRGNIHNVQ